MRGKIRRVWRHRYLELLDNGHVKYYEEEEEEAAAAEQQPHHRHGDYDTSAWEEDLSLGTTGSQQSHLSQYNQSLSLPPSSLYHSHSNRQQSQRQQQQQHSSHHPYRSRRYRRRHYKYRLQILQARILDGTTLRDLHVGLPRGAYGWVFRARRLILVQGGADDPTNSDGRNGDPTNHDTNDDTGMEDDNHYLAADPAEDDYLPPHSMTTTTPTTTTTTTTTGSYWTVDPLKEERDFYCAVSQLEHAQMWVVALQWAASVTTSTTSTMSTLSPTTRAASNYHHNNVRGNSLQNAYLGGGGNTRTTTSTATATTDKTNRNSHNPTNLLEDDWEHASKPSEDYPPQQQQQRHADDHNDDDDDDEIASFVSYPSFGDGSSAVRHATVPSTPPPSSSSTKAPMRRSPPLPARRHRHSSSSTTNTKMGTMVVTKVMGWQIVRTAPTQWNLAYSIHVLQCRRSSSSSSVLLNPKSWMIWRTVADMQRLVRTLQSHSDVPLFPVRVPPVLTSLSSSSSSSSSTEYVHLWVWLDWFLRKLVTDGTFVNTQPVKEFLGLTASASTSSTATTTTTTSPSTNHASPTNVITTSTTQSWYTSIHHILVSLWQLHSTTHVYPLPTTTASSGAVSLESYVKEWLADRPSPHGPPRWTQALLWCQTQWGLPTTTTTYSRHVWWAAAAGGTLVIWWWCGGGRGRPDDDEPFVPYTSVSRGSSSSSMSSSWWWGGQYIALRWDVLVASWVGAAYLGHLVWPSTAATSSTTTSNKVPSTTSTTTTTTTRRQHRQQQRQRQRPSKQDESSVVMVPDNDNDDDDGAISSLDHATTTDDADTPVHGDDNDDDDDDSFGDAMEGPMRETLANDDDDDVEPQTNTLSSPLPRYPDNDGQSCWSQPASDIFYVRSETYLQDRVKEPSGAAPLTCRGVDVWMTDTPERHIARHPAVLGGRLRDEDTFLVNFLLPFGNFVAYFGIPPLSEFPPKLRTVWTKFLAGDQQYRDARLKLLPVVVEGPWIVKAAVGPGKSPALLGKVIPLQYFFDAPTAEGEHGTPQRKAVYEVDVIITASTIAKGILSVVKGHTKSVSIAFAFIIEAAEQADLPENVLCTFQVHTLHLEECPVLPPLPDDDDDDDRSDENHSVVS